MKELWDALITWMRAQSELDKARAEYDGYSWDWVAGRQIDQVEKLRDEAEAKLNEYIDSRVRAVLDERD